MELSILPDTDIILNKIDFSNSIVKSSIKEIHTILDVFYKQNDIIDSIYIYSKSNEYVFSNRRITSNETEIFDDKDFIRSLPMESTDVRSRILAFADTKLNYFSISIPVKTQDEYSGILVLNINSQLLYDKYKTFNSYINNYYLFSEDDTVLATNLSDRCNADIQKLFSKKKCNNIKSSNSFCSDIENDGEYISTQKLANGYTLVFEDKNPEISKQFRKAQVITVSTIILVLLLNILISLLLTTYIYQFIAILVTAFERPNNISDTKILKLGAYNEISFLLNTVLNHSNYSHVDEEFKKRIAALEKQHSLSLQAQINPHFISNTLNSINSLVMRTFKEESAISVMITHLSEILRYTFRISDNIVSLKTELDYLKHYIEIEKIKSNNKFNIIYNIDDDTLNNPVIKLALQPIVENAIFHGVKNKGGTIEICSYYQNEDLILKISDDGNGFDDKILNELNSFIAPKSDIFQLPTKYIGLVNTHRRINLLFGENYGCKISQTANRTTVYISFPKKSEEI